MNILTVKLKRVLRIALIVISPLTALAQANTPPAGSSSNLCPGQTYRYTSGAANDGGLCNRLGGWIVENGKIIGDGVGANNSVWADVQWDNATNGRIGNFCGVLSVTIAAISQPSIVGPSTILLCGTSSLTISASVASQANVVGYTWNVVGTGVTPTGVVNTTAPQITINYTNWTAGSSLSATVAVAVRHSCGFSTAVSPLTTQNPLPGVTIPAIPRTAWVQLSPGNINSLQAPLNFRVLLPDGSQTSAICSSGTFTVTNQPSGSTLAWSSTNTSALTINSSTGAAVRENSSTGSVTVTANLSNACGSFDQTTSIWLGIPTPPGVVSGETSPSVGGIYTYTSASPSQGAVSYNWILPFGGNPLWSQSNGNINGVINTLTPSLLIGSSSGWLQIYGINQCGNSSVRRLRVFPVAGGGGGQQQRIAFPNPAGDKVNIKIKDEDSEDEAEITLINKNFERVFSKQTKEREMTISTSNLPEGLYYLNITTGKEKTQKQLIIKH